MNEFCWVLKELKAFYVVCGYKIDCCCYMSYDACLLVAEVAAYVIEKLSSTLMSSIAPRVFKRVSSGGCRSQSMAGVPLLLTIVSVSLL